MRLADWRKSEGKTQEWLAGALEISQPLVSKIEAGGVMPRFAVMVRIILVTRFKVLPNDFFPIDRLRSEAAREDRHDEAA